MQNAITVDERDLRSTPFQTVEGVCGVSARMSGVATLGIQFIVLLISCLLTAVLFVHIGGYMYFMPLQRVLNNETEMGSARLEGWTGSTPADTMPSELTSTSLNDYSVTLDGRGGGDESGSGGGDGSGLGETSSSSDNNETGGQDQVSHLLGDEYESADPSTNSTAITSTTTNRNYSLPIYHGPFEQIRPVTLTLGTMQVELLPLLRISCMVYKGFCILWLVSLIGLLLSLKLELIDLVYINIFFLAVMIVATLVEAVMIGTLIFYQTELRWNILLTISVAVGGLTVGFIFNCIAMAFLITFYRYIDYMSGSNECLCLSSITRCVKGQHAKRGQEEEAVGAEYSIPEATRHANLPYIDDPPIQQFHNF